MALKAVYDKIDDCPENFRELYTEKDGKHELTGIEGVKTQADVDRLNTSLQKERGDHKATKEKLTVWGDLDNAQVTKDLIELTEARVRLEAGEGKIDEERFNKLVEARVATTVATQVVPVKRENDQLKETLVKRDATVSAFEKKDTTRTVTDAVRAAATTLKVVGTAMDDVIMLAERVFEITEDGGVLTRDKVGVTPGIAPDIWLSEMRDKRPHWWPASTGGGAGGNEGGGGFTDNPFSAEHWNLTKQGAAIREDRAKAERMAKAAGTTIGGLKPAAPKKAAA